MGTTEGTHEHSMNLGIYLISHAGVHVPLFLDEKAEESLRDEGT